jgi:hypothetical protein
MIAASRLPDRCHSTSVVYAGVTLTPAPPHPSLQLTLAQLSLIVIPARLWL